MIPRHFKKYCDVYVQKQKNKAIETDYSNFNLGKYIAYAVNDPKKYPNEPFLTHYEEKKDNAMTSQEMERVVKNYTIKLGGKIKWH